MTFVDLHVEKRLFEREGYASSALVIDKRLEEILLGEGFDQELVQSALESEGRHLTITAVGEATFIRELVSRDMEIEKSGALYHIKDFDPVRKGIEDYLTIVSHLEGYLASFLDDRQDSDPDFRGFRVARLAVMNIVRAVDVIPQTGSDYLKKLVGTIKSLAATRFYKLMQGPIYVIEETNDSGKIDYKTMVRSEVGFCERFGKRFFPYGVGSWLIERAQNTVVDPLREYALDSNEFKSAYDAVGMLDSLLTELKVLEIARQGTMSP